MQTTAKLENEVCKHHLRFNTSNKYHKLQFAGNLLSRTEGCCNKAILMLYSSQGIAHNS